MGPDDAPLARMEVNVRSIKWAFWSLCCVVANVLGWLFAPLTFWPGKLWYASNRRHARLHGNLLQLRWLDCACNLADWRSALYQARVRRSNEAAGRFLINSRLLVRKLSESEALRGHVYAKRQGVRLALHPQSNVVNIRALSRPPL